MYTASSIYVTLNKNSDENLLKEGLTEYKATRTAEEDEEFYNILLSYNVVFESVKAYENTSEEFKNLPKGLIILMELYGYEGCSISHIAEMIDEDKRVVSDNVGLLKSILMQMGNYQYNIEQDDEKQKKHRHIKGRDKHSNQEDEEDEVGVIDMLFPRLSKKQRTLIDITLAAIIFIVGMVILRF